MLCGHKTRTACLDTEACRGVTVALAKIEFSHVWQTANQWYGAILAQVIIRSKKRYRNFDPSMYRSKNDNVAIRKPKRVVLCACAEHPCWLVSCAMRKAQQMQQTNNAVHAADQKIMRMPNTRVQKRKMTTNNAPSAATCRRTSQRDVHDSLVTQDVRKS
jgi:hypothetical protein